MKQSPYKFAIPELPPSVNHLYRTTFQRGRQVFYKEQAVKDFEQLAAYTLKRLATPLTGWLELSVVFTFSKPAGFKRRDLDNMLKLTLDALATRGIIENDNQIVKITCQKKTGAQDSVAGSIFVFVSKGD